MPAQSSAVLKFWIKKMPLKQGTETSFYTSIPSSQASYKKDAPKAGDGNLTHFVNRRHLIIHKKDAPKAGDGNAMRTNISVLSIIYKKDAPKAGDGNV